MVKEHICHIQKSRTFGKSQSDYGSIRHSLWIESFAMHCTIGLTKMINSTLSPQAQCPIKRQDKLRLSQGQCIDSKLVTSLHENMASDSD